MGINALNAAAALLHRRTLVGAISTEHTTVSLGRAQLDVAILTSVENHANICGKCFNFGMTTMRASDLRGLRYLSCTLHKKECGGQNGNQGLVNAVHVSLQISKNMSAQLFRAEKE
jgi:hypothetical protein